MTRPRHAGALAATLVLACMGTSTSLASSADDGSVAARLTRAHTIRSELDARVRRLPDAGLAITEPATTATVESFTLLSEDLLERRFVPARQGVWYALCPLGGSCPSPAPRLARPAAQLLPRRLALELAVRTFLETDATLVAVSLPTPRIVAVVITREELEADVDLPTLLRELRTEPLLAPSAGLRQAVDELTRTRTFVFLGWEPGPTGGPSWAGMPRWPSLSW